MLHLLSHLDMTSVTLTQALYSITLCRQRPLREKERQLNDYAKRPRLSSKSPESTQRQSVIGGETRGEAGGAFAPPPQIQA